jgi:hypothetical protein
MNQISFQSAYSTQDAPQVAIGQRASTPDGREWQYVKANSALAKGSVAVPVAVTAVDTVSSSTDSQGRIVYITKASAGWTVGAFEGSWVVVDDGTGVGQTAKVIDNTTDTLVLAPETALTTALSVTDSDITIFSNSVVEKSAITDKVQRAVGIAQVAIAAGDYGWVLSRGIGAVLAGEALTVGKSFVTGDDTTGQVVKGTTAKGDFDEQSLGIALVANAAADQLALVRAQIA